MTDIPSRPPPLPPPLPSGWTEHKAPSGHSYYYNKESKKSTYTRPIAEPTSVQYIPPSLVHPPIREKPTLEHAASELDQNAFQHQRSMQDLIFASAPKQFIGQRESQHQVRSPNRGGFNGGFHDRRREQDDRPKHRQDIPNCAPWVLVKTGFKRRFVWNKNTNESFWKFPPHVMTAVVEFDRWEREKRGRRERGEPSDNEEEDTAMAEIEADLAEAEENLEIVEVDGEESMEREQEYEEIEVTDDEGEDVENLPKRHRTEEPPGDKPLKAEDDDLAWQLAQMEEMENMELAGDYDEEMLEDEGDPLTEEDCKALFKELLDDSKISPFRPWDKVLEDGILFHDERYKALANMAARKGCFNEWSRERAQSLKEEKARMAKQDPRILYLAFLDEYATPKLYWPEFRRKYKKEAELKDTKLLEKDKEKLYRDHIKRLGMRASDLKSDLSSLLREQPLALLNRSSNLNSLPIAILNDLRYISLSPSTRNALVETYISTLPNVPGGTVYSAEEEIERAKKLAERERREKALADRERRVKSEKQKQERDLAYGKSRLRDEEEEIARAMKVGKDGLKGQLIS